MKLWDLNKRTKGRKIEKSVHANFLIAKMKTWGKLTDQGKSDTCDALFMNNNYTFINNFISIRNKIFTQRDQKLPVSREGAFRLHTIVDSPGCNKIRLVYSTMPELFKGFISSDTWEVCLSITRVVKKDRISSTCHLMVAFLANCSPLCL